MFINDEKTAVKFSNAFANAGLGEGGSTSTKSVARKCANKRKGNGDGDNNAADQNRTAGTKTGTVKTEVGTAARPT